MYNEAITYSSMVVQNPILTAVEWLFLNPLAAEIAGMAKGPTHREPAMSGWGVCLQGSGGRAGLDWAGSGWVPCLPTPHAWFLDPPPPPQSRRRLDLKFCSPIEAGASRLRKRIRGRGGGPSPRGEQMQCVCVFCVVCSLCVHCPSSSPSIYPYVRIFNGRVKNAGEFYIKI